MKNAIPNFSQARLLVLLLSLMCGAAAKAFAQIPAVGHFSPNSAPVGTTIIITGTNFISVSSVKFNNTPAASFTVNSTTEISAVVAAGTTIGKVSVTTATGTANSTSDFTPYVTWTGGFSNDWRDSRNWADGVLPGATTNVVINSGTANSPQINGSAQCNNLTISTGAMLELKAGADLAIKGVFSNLGTYIHNAGKITFAADGGNQQIPALTYFDLAIDGAGTKMIQGNITVQGDLTFGGANNNLVMAQTTNTLTLNGNIIGETPTRSFIGRLEKTREIVGYGNDTFGNIGISFDNTGGGYWGTVIATRITGTALVNGTYQSIKRSWNIVPEFLANDTVMLTLTWFDTENNLLSFPNNKAQAWRSENDGLNWEPVDGPQTITPAGNTRSITVQTTSFSKWGVSDENNPLPVSWLYFTGKATASGNLLSWSTASEKNTENFVVERSVNGKTFETIGQVKAAGNSSHVLTYTFNDASPATGKTYYRLKQTDADGAFTYSAMIVVVKTVKTPALEVAVYPNPFAETLNLKFQAGHVVSEVKLLTLDGKEVYRNVVTPGADIIIGKLPVLKPGVYLLQLQSANGITTLKVARQ